MTDILKPGKFICPPNFQPIEGRSTVYLEDLEDDDTELWIIQAPVGVDVSKLNGQSIDLESFSYVNSIDDKPHLQCIPTQYEENYESDFHLIVPKKSDKTLTCVPKSFKGHLLITEYVSTSNLTSISTDLGNNENLDSENETQQTINEEPARKKKKEKHKNKNTSEHFASDNSNVSSVFTNINENVENINYNMENDELNIKKKHKKKKSKERDLSSTSHLEYDDLKNNESSNKTTDNQENASEPMDFDNIQIKEEKKSPKKKKRSKHNDTNVTGLNDTEMSVNNNEVTSSEGHIKKKSHKSSKKKVENQEIASESIEYGNVENIENKKKSSKKKRNKHNDTTAGEFNDTNISVKEEVLTSPTKNSNVNIKKKKKKKKHDEKC